LTNNYYQQKIAALSAPVDSLDPTERFSWGSYAGLLGGMAGDPGLNIRLARAMLPRLAQWQISEWRPQGRRDDIRSGLRNYGDAYVTVTYSSIESAPQLHDKFLQHVILDFTMDADQHLVLDMKRVEAGDTFWPPDHVARLYLDRARGALTLNEPDVKEVSVSLDAAVENSPTQRNSAGMIVWNALEPRLRDLHSLGRDRFLSLFGLCERYGVPAEYQQNPKYEFAQGLALYERGSAETALPLLRLAALANPSSIEGKLAAQLASPVGIGLKEIHDPLYRFDNSCYGPDRGEWLSLDFEIQLLTLNRK
jgi:hypothetical protein